jgi:DNA-binding LytR/AlgR family response regulator
MENLKIGIVEDDLIIAESIVQILKHLGYRTTQPVRNYADALTMINAEAPDLLLIDIILVGSPDGIELAKKVREDNTCPFIFITGNSDRPTVDRAKEVRPYAYLVKPFNENDLFSAIEIAFSAFNHEEQLRNREVIKTTNGNDFIFIKENHLFHKIELKEIIYIESENVYLNIHTTKRKYLVRSKLDEFISDFANENFFRIHRSYAINIKHLETINSLSVKVGGQDIPLHKPYKQELLSVFKSI